MDYVYFHDSLDSLHHYDSSSTGQPEGKKWSHWFIFTHKIQYQASKRLKFVVTRQLIDNLHSFLSYLLSILSYLLHSFVSFIPNRNIISSFNIMERDEILYIICNICFVHKTIVWISFRLVVLIFLYLNNLLLNLIGSTWLGRFGWYIRKLLANLCIFILMNRSIFKFEFGDFIWQVNEDLISFNIISVMVEWLKFCTSLKRASYFLVCVFP